MMIFRSLVLITLFFVFSTYSFAGQYSAGPRQTGEEVLDELLIGTDSIFAKVGSNGCTGKGSFRIDIKKEEGVSSRTPHYVLTINRISKDECKAIVEDGALIFWDLEKDLGLTGNYTFSVTNMVHNVDKKLRLGRGGDDNSLVSIIKKHVTAVGVE